MGWTNATSGGFAVAAANTTALDLLGAFTVGEKFNIGTILRVVGVINYRGAVANATIIARWGLAIVSDDALALGSVPDPVGDPSFGWFFNDSLMWNEPNQEHRERNIDLGTSRRLIGDASTLIASFENGSGSSQNLEVKFALRILYRKK